MPDDAMQPSAEVRSRLGVRVLADLGGRVNRHWRVAAASGDDELVLRRWGYGDDDVQYERAVLDALARAGWPVPVVLGEPVRADGAWWSLSPLLPGAALDAETPAQEAARGALLADLHATTAGFDGIGRRPGWRSAAEVLADPELEPRFRAAEHRRPDELRIVRRHHDLARAAFDAAAFSALPTVVIHGDWAVHNVLRVDGRLSGVIDLELARRDVRIAEFCLAWRGRHDDLVRGYDEVAPLSDAERRLLAPVWWAFLIESAGQLLARGEWDDGWIAAKLERRSPLLAEWSG